jgi:soluble lytic murein transglycosylase-like protein
MSTQPVLGATAGQASSEGPSGALAASERMQRLQALIEQVEQGPSGFAAALAAAERSPASAQSSGAVYPSAQPSTSSSAATASYQDAGQSAAYPAAYQTLTPTVTPTSGQIPVSAGVSASTGGEAGSAYAPLIDQAAARNGLDPAVLYGLIQQESGFDPNATSSAGALGLTQLMPSTASSLGVSEPLNPAQSIEGGARYLGQLMQQFAGNTTDALAAYNAGPGAVQQYGGVPPYAETQQYVTNVLANAATYQQSAGAGDAIASTAPGAAAAGIATSATPQAIA